MSLKEEKPVAVLVVIGGGAAGFFCAVNAARLVPDLKVVLLEKTGKLLSKVRISGGGRCNVTHACFDIAEMSRRYPRGQHFVKKSFHQFFTTDTIAWFRERGVAIKSEEDGRMFPVSDSSEIIINCLLREAGKYGLDIRMNAEARQIKPLEEGFLIDINGKESIQADFVCLATGGYPKATMFNWLQHIGHSFEPPVPSLFTFNLPGHTITSLMGVSVEKARVKIEGTKLAEEGPLLITHWGLSGPAILKTSAWGARVLAEKNYAFRAHINWIPEMKEQEVKEALSAARINHSQKKIINHNWLHLPSRLWQYLLESAGINSDMRFADLPSKMENMLVRQLTDFIVDVKGKTTYKEEFVTAGGIRLSEIDASTMMSKKQENLFFAGEIMDVDGITGGYNFQHAWTSGYIAATTIAEKLKGQ